VHSKGDSEMGEEKRGGADVGRLDRNEDRACAVLQKQNEVYTVNFFFAMDDNTFNKIHEGLDAFVPLIPDKAMQFAFAKAGIPLDDPKLKKLVALVTEKLLTDVVSYAYQYHKIAQRALLKDKKIPKEKKLTLTFSDVENALEEVGVNVFRPSYYSW